MLLQSRARANWEAPFGFFLFISIV